MSKLQRGFTLVEIAIVLVIIGLLLGGILKGQEMITQAKIKNAIADFSGISAAFYGYQDRYRAIPGDDPNAPTRWSTRPAASAGTPGNGVVEGSYNNGGAGCPSGSTASIETCMWWDDLRLSGFVSGAGDQSPFNAFSGLIGVETGDGQTPAGPALETTVGANGFTGLIVCSANIPDKVAISIDTQMDDGHIATGTVRGQLQAAPNPAIATTAPATDYAETGTNVYTMCKQL
jgi:prepilin-type N-terminal cleavage/methylation domain-containing protein